MKIAIASEVLREICSIRTVHTYVRVYVQTHTSFPKLQYDFTGTVPRYWNGTMVQSIKTARWGAVRSTVVKE